MTEYERALINFRSRSINRLAIVSLGFAGATPFLPPVDSVWPLGVLSWALTAGCLHYLARRVLGGLDR